MSLPSRALSLSESCAPFIRSDVVALESRKCLPHQVFVYLGPSDHGACAAACIFDLEGLPWIPPEPDNALVGRAHPCRWPSASTKAGHVRRVKVHVDNRRMFLL
jgi:hypothetical protein